MKLTKKLENLLVRHLLRNDDQAAIICREAVQRIKEQVKQIDELDAKVDALMLEYCPNEMTDNQIDNWAANQKRGHRMRKKYGVKVVEKHCDYVWFEADSAEEAEEYASCWNRGRRNHKDKKM